MTGDLNTAFGHRPIHIRGAAAATSLKAGIKRSVVTLLLSPSVGRVRGWSRKACHLFQTFYCLFHIFRFSFCRILPLRGSLSPALRAPPSSRGNALYAYFNTPRRFHFFMRRTTILHFSFLISHSSEAFQRNQGTERPMSHPEPTPSVYRFSHSPNSLFRYRRYSWRTGKKF